MCEAVTEQPIALESVALKTCSKCKTEKPLTEFPSKGSLCKVCKRIQSRSWFENNKKTPPQNLPKSKICKTCHILKPLSDFGKSLSMPDWLQASCKVCQSNKTKKSHAKNAQKNAGSVQIPDFKLCPKCCTLKKGAEFYKARAMPDGLCCYCKSCQDDFIMFDRYGIPPGWFEETLRSQGGQCGICKKEHTEEERQRFSIDHNHLTDIVRGILCKRCNWGLGMFKDDVRRIRAAIDYLIENGAIEGDTRPDLFPKTPWVNKKKEKLLLEAQGWSCKICKDHLIEGTRQCHLDHDHKTGKIRGYLCHTCNVGLGYFKDSITALRGAVVYLEKYAYTNIIEEIRG